MCIQGSERAEITDRVARDASAVKWKLMGNKGKSDFLATNTTKGIHLPIRPQRVEKFYLMKNAELTRMKEMIRVSSRNKQKIA